MQNCTVLFHTQNEAMMEHRKILQRIEDLIEQLPYQWVKIEVELPQQTLILEKERRKAIGFATEE